MTQQQHAKHREDNAFRVQEIRSLSVGVARFVEDGMDVSCGCNDCTREYNLASGHRRPCECVECEQGNDE